MRKIYLILLMCVSAVTLNAQVFTEYFQDATPGGELEGYNEWYVCPKPADAFGVTPKIEGETLFYDGYIGSDTGYVAVLDSLVGFESSTQRISTRVVTLAPGDTLRPIIGEKFYAAFIITIQEHSKNSFRDFFTWEGSTTSSWQRGRVFAKVQNGGQDLQFAVSKNSSSSGTYVESEIIEGGVEGVYYLLVLAYESIEGDNNDVITLYINPDPTLPEAEQTNKLVAIDTEAQSDYSEGTEMKINLRQRGVGALVGGIRVGRNWEHVLQGDKTAVRELKSSANNIRSFRNTIITDAPGTIQVYDISGRKVMSQITNGRLETSLGTGLYIVHFEDNNGKFATGKVSLSAR